MPLAELNGTHLYYEVHGSGDETIVFAHGRGGNHLSWWQQVPDFARDYRCVVFDHRSFGASERPEGAAGQEAFAGDLTALLDHLGVARTHLVAQSMGGRTCLDFALAHPERTGRLVLAGTIAGVVDPDLAKLVAVLGPAPQDLMQRVLSSGFRQREPVLAFLYEEIEALNHLHGSPLKLATKGPGKEDLQRCHIPTLLIVGDEDPLAPPDAARWLAAHLPDARAEILPGAGHSAYFERPQQFNRLVRNFLSGATAG